MSKLQSPALKRRTTLNHPSRDDDEKWHWVFQPAGRVEGSGASLASGAQPTGKSAIRKETSPTPDTSLAASLPSGCGSACHPDWVSPGGQTCHQPGDFPPG